MAVSNMIVTYIPNSTLTDEGVTLARRLAQVIQHDLHVAERVSVDWDQREAVLRVWPVPGLEVAVLRELRALLG